MMFLKRKNILNWYVPRPFNRTRNINYIYTSIFVSGNVV